jgi:oxygen-independent coproporphyrinogen-3 oxidase
MIGLITNYKPFFGDICDEIRLFFAQKKIDDVQKAAVCGLFVRVFFYEDAIWQVECEVILDGIIRHDYKDSMPGETGSALQVKKIKKRFVKKAVYELLKEYTGQKPPWGALTGIRPTKLARDLLSEMGKNARDFFQKEFDVDAPKTQLAFDIVETQLPVIEKITNHDIDIYVGIPFCISRCSYCSFVSRDIGKCKGLDAQYMEALLCEINGAKDILLGRNIRCVYVGGGTPTALSAAQLKMLFKAVNQSFPGYTEFTVEAGRPDTIDENRLKVIRDAGATRICVNAQTTNTDTLARIGRAYGSAEFGRAFELVRKFGFDNVNTDIILGLPGENLSDVKKTLADVCAYKPENVTVHTLAVKNAANLTLEETQKYADADAVNGMVEFSRTFLQDRGYLPYYLYRQKYMAGNMENVGYAQPGKLCLYNIDIMEELADNVSFGAGGMSKRIFHGKNRIERSCNLKEVGLYIRSIDDMIGRKHQLFK